MIDVYETPLQRLAPHPDTPTGSTMPICVPPAMARGPDYENLETKSRTPPYDSHYAMSEEPEDGYLTLINPSSMPTYAIPAGSCEPGYETPISLPKQARRIYP